MGIRISLRGYDLIDGGKNGIRYAWDFDGGKYFVESAAFPQRSVGLDDGICGYTTSVSGGCILRVHGRQCRFCRTGNLLPFSGILSFREIAKQNIMMVLADMECSDHPELKDRPREFAYMGQGEPGYAYPQVRLAIELTNRVMKQIDQKVFRHIFATSGVPEAVMSYKSDLVNFFTERVTLHFSLHGMDHRGEVMPIDDLYPYSDCLRAMDDVYELSGEKPCIGIILFDDFAAQGKTETYSLDSFAVEQILSALNPQKFRVSFCDFNPSGDVGTAEVYPEEQARNILEMAKKMGFEAKLFFSYGQKEKTACGLLGSKEPDFIAGKKWMELEKYAEELIDKNERW